MYPSIPIHPQDIDFVQAVVTRDTTIAYEANIYPLRFFRLPTERWEEVFDKNNREAVKNFVKFGPEYTERLLNLNLNKDFRALYEQGVIVLGPTEELSITTINAYDLPKMLSMTHDGLTSLRPGLLPPTNDATHWKDKKYFTLLSFVYVTLCTQASFLYSQRN